MEVVTVSPATTITSSSEQEWRVLETEQKEWLGQFYGGSNGVSTGVKPSGKAHAASYRPDLPLRSSPGAVNAWADGIIRRQGAQKQTRKSPAPKTVVRLSSPHPSSYRPELPLRGFTDAQLVKATAEDRAYWLEHPLTYKALEGRL